MQTFIHSFRKVINYNVKKWVKFRDCFSLSRWNEQKRRKWKLEAKAPQIKKDKFSQW
jgi:hypothetical protein